MMGIINIPYVSWLDRLCVVTVWGGLKRVFTQQLPQLVDNN